MKAYTASLINAVVLIVISSLGYFLSETPSMTALIPAAIGIVLVGLNPGVKKENKVIAHIAVVLTLIILIALVMPLNGAIQREDAMAIVRVAIMLVSTIVAMVFFVKSFIAAKKARTGK